MPIFEDLSELGECFSDYAAIESRVRETSNEADESGFAHGGKAMGTSPVNSCTKGCYQQSSKLRHCGPLALIATDELDSTAHAIRASLLAAVTFATPGGGI